LFGESKKLSMDATDAKSVWRGDVSVTPECGSNVTFVVRFKRFGELT
uniref:C2 tensin-type domain-containing protein n=1 Tax=Gongylonema pulchrum TaxID=637853 RepID=A0A183EX09_9BILA